MKKILLLLGIVSAAWGLLLLGVGLAQVGERPAKLTWSAPDVKSSLMSVGYKVYANRSVEQGRHYLSKLVFKNVGEHPVTDFAISYKIDDWVDWTEPSRRQQVPADFSFVELYFPRLPGTVSKLRNAATTTFRTRIQWKEEGRPKEEVFARDLVLRAVNEVAFCDVPASEAVTFFDYCSASAFCVSMVTPNDPVVELYAGEITKLAGGTTAGIAGGPQEVQRLCQATYDYMVRSGLRYVGDSGVPATYDNITTLIQTVRLPRDVIVNNQGLCIELSLLWCSVLEHLGVRTVIFLVPGHAFVLAYSPSQGMPMEAGIPIECTAITPRAVGKEDAVPFAEAVKMAVEEVQRAYKSGQVIVLNIKDLQAAGFTPPELPEVDTAKLAGVLAGRIGGFDRPGNVGGGAPGSPAAEAAAPAPLSPEAEQGRPAPANEDNGYEDPQGRFYVGVAPGWKPTPVGPNGSGGVALSKGEGSLVISPFGGVQRGPEVVASLVQQLAPQFRNFKQLSQAQVILGARNAWISRYTGVSPKGTPSRITLAGVDATYGGPAYAMIISLPESLYPTERQSVDQMLQSFEFSR